MLNCSPSCTQISLLFAQYNYNWQTKGLTLLQFWSFHSKLNSVLFFDGSNDDKIKFLKNFLSKSSTGLEGINEIENLTKLSKEFIFDINLARGLSYYTSSIFEVILDEKNIGSLCGGGRWWFNRNRK